MTTTPDDARHMGRALQLAQRGLYTTDPNPRVGCVIVKDGRVIGEGWHERAGAPHAEVNAIRATGQEKLYGTTAYVTLEPCCHYGKTPPCTRALIDAAVGRVVVAMRDPNPEVAGNGVRRLEEAGIPVTVGLMGQEAAALNPGFISRMQRGRPWVRVKLATSLDGRTALSHGESKWITAEPARADVQQWRARSSAILTGVSTVLVDDPSLNVRDYDIGRQPMRVVVDSTLRMPPESKMLKLDGHTLVVTASDDTRKAKVLQQAGAEVLFLSSPQHRIDLRLLMTDLSARQVNELHVEAGATLSGALLELGLIDELVLYLAPHIMGNQARGMFNFPPLVRMEDRYDLNIVDMRAVGDDWRVICRPKNSAVG